MALIGRKPKLKIFYASDIHGSERVFRKFLNAGEFYHADALVFGGDLTGKAVIPFVEHTPGQFTVDVFGVTRVVSTGAELTELEQFVRDKGSTRTAPTPSSCRPCKMTTLW